MVLGVPISQHYRVCFYFGLTILCQYRSKQIVCGLAVEVIDKRLVRRSSTDSSSLKVKSKRHGSENLVIMILTCKLQLKV